MRAGVPKPWQDGTRPSGADNPGKNKGRLMGANPYSTETCGFRGRLTLRGFARFVLDLAVNSSDTIKVGTMAQLIYSPLDTPQGLRRGYLFKGSVRGAAYAS